MGYRSLKNRPFQALEWTGLLKAGHVVKLQHTYAIIPSRCAPIYVGGGLVASIAKQHLTCNSAFHFGLQIPFTAIKIIFPFHYANYSAENQAYASLSLSTAGSERLPIPMHLEDQFRIIPFQK
jgi:hypothetical protein